MRLNNGGYSLSSIRKLYHFLTLRKKDAMNKSPPKPTIKNPPKHREKSFGGSHLIKNIFN